MKTLLLTIVIFVTATYAQNNLSAIQKPISVKEKKANFRKVIVPAVDEVYNELQVLYNDINTNIQNPDYSQKIQELKNIYKIKSDEELLMALKPHPRSIAIAQAAMESAWITSRFYREANNIFGVWSRNKDEPRIAALQKRGSYTVWVKKYSSVKESVRHYYKTLARSKAFKEFRELKMKTDDPYELVKKLDRYSEIGAKYGEDLSSIIRYNKFYLYDR